MTARQPDAGSPPPKSASRVELAYATLRERITSGVYGPGHRLVLDELARELGVSPVPVREAVRRLEAEGYVEFQRNVGARVATFDEQEFVQTVHVVALLEGYATALAAPHLRRADLARARKINDRMQASLDDLDPVRFSALNREFHFALYERCPNQHIQGLLETQWARLDTIRRSVFRYVPDRSRSSVAEHAELLDLIAAGAPVERIEQVARAHKMHTGAAVSEAGGAPG
ncbi:GntR family transcriptional regulator [Streptomyces phyllanthi]|uniref:GntR family transcriptional regulator n=1 Tax=Streptomyces phyllanthi TaxID=1803180 RepID=A0A5N8VU81_9ACTN|nr:GntR family transcriptional regulator [Streptomyces phyllanthi]MPY38831.1 GntR family transcriptional regulator [Streptomyces phyllanthi]